MSYTANPPYRVSGKARTVIPWEEWRDSILGEKKETDRFKEGDGIKNAERILKKFRKKGYKRAATPEEIKEIKERRAKNK